MSLHLAVMGVAGTGKSCIAASLSDALRMTFIEGDEFHPPENIEKMRQGISLVDADRQPWLATLNAQLRDIHEQSWVLAASLLKQRYRDWCFADVRVDVLVYLYGDEALIMRRLEQRQAGGEHFMPASLCQSQFAQLEPPHDALVINVQQTPEEIVNEIKTELIKRHLWP